MGKELLRKIRYTIHDCRSTKLVSIGRLKTGGHVRVVVATSETGETSLTFEFPEGPVTPKPEKISPPKAKASGSIISAAPLSSPANCKTSSTRV